MINYSSKLYRVYTVRRTSKSRSETHYGLFDGENCIRVAEEFSAHMNRVKLVPPYYGKKWKKKKNNLKGYPLSYRLFDEYGNELLIFPYKYRR